MQNSELSDEPYLSSEPCEQKMTENDIGFKTESLVVHNSPSELAV